MTSRDGRPPSRDPRPGTRTGRLVSDGAGSIRRDSVPFESQGVRCEADLYRPPGGNRPWPTVVMANVMGAPRAWGLAPFAERFARAGIAAFAFDYRHLGTSAGTPRRLIDPRRQLEDWTAALAHARSLAVVDADRVALWGASLSGGHVLAMADRDPGVVAAVAQTPFVDGRATVAHQVRPRGPAERARSLGLALADRLLSVVGLGPVELAVVSEPGGGGLVDSPGAMAGFLSLAPEGAAPVNRTPARVVLDMLFYRPGREVGALDVPLHVVVAEEDRLLPLGPIEGLVDRLAAPSVHRVPAGHFDGFHEPWFEPVVEAQVAFLEASLLEEG